MNDDKLLNIGNIIYLFLALIGLIIGNSLFIMFIFLSGFIIILGHTFNLKFEVMLLSLVFLILLNPLIYLIFSTFFLILIFPILAIYFISIFRLWNK